jgi:hypothetical protein
MRDVITQGIRHRHVMGICRKIMKSQYLRIQKLLINNRIKCEEGREDKFRLHNGTYKSIAMISSKEFRVLLKGKQVGVRSKLGENLD